MDSSDDGAGDSGRTRPLGRAGRGASGKIETAGTAPAPPVAAQDTPRTADGAPSGEPVAPGSLLGRYEVVAKLGEGGMGIVLLASDPSLGRKVALKVLHAGGAEDAEAARRRLMREAQGTAQLSHENVITVHDVGTHDGRVYLAMEFVAGRTLGRWQQHRGWREIVQMYARAGRGLLAAHDAGLVHRDFKPDNVLVGDDGRLRVTDFGLVAAVDDEAPQVSATSAMRRKDLELAVSMTKTGSIMGTPRYMAPEQHMGLPCDARADQFAFCVALYEALYRQLPFPGESYPQLLAAVIEGQPTPVPADAEVPPVVGELILRGLSRRHQDRHPSMRELLAGLTAAIEAPPGRRRWWPFAALGAVGVAAVASVIVATGSRSTRSTGPVAMLVRGALDAGLAADAPAAKPDVDAAQPPDAIGATIAALFDPSSAPAARKAAVTELARSSDERAALALLRAAKSDPDPSIRKAARDSVEQYLDVIATLSPPPPHTGTGTGTGAGMGVHSRPKPPPHGGEVDVAMGDGFPRDRPDVMPGSGAASKPPPPPPPAPPPQQPDRPWARGVSDQQQAAALKTFTAANAMLSAGDTAGAIEGYRKALAQWDHPAIHYNVATAMMARGDRAGAITELRAALKYPAALGDDKAAAARRKLAELTAARP